jgi:pSer/pThr/pTyr-binding forkhead associated (FHA) protein
MNRITRLFGGKTDSEKDGKIEQTGSTGVNSAPERVIQDLGGQEFGLMFTFENGQAKTYTTLPITIGRNDQNTIVLQDPTVSSQHAYVYFDQRLQRVCISDLGSKNGVYINEQPTRKNVLQDDVRIRLGNVGLTFRDTGYIPSSDFKAGENRPTTTSQ